MGHPLHWTYLFTTGSCLFPNPRPLLDLAQTRRCSWLAGEPCFLSRRGQLPPRATSCGATTAAHPPGASRRPASRWGQPPGPVAVPHLAGACRRAASRRASCRATSQRTAFPWRHQAPVRPMCMLQLAMVARWMSSPEAHLCLIVFRLFAMSQQSIAPAI